MESDGFAASRHLPGNLRALREHQGMSQAALATAMRERGWSWHQTTVVRVEGGQQQPGYGEVVDLAVILGVSLARLSYATGEAADLMLAEGAIIRLREAAEESASSLTRLCAERAAAERAARDAGKSKYPRVRDTARAIEAELEGATVQHVLAESSERWNDLKEGCT